MKKLIRSITFTALILCLLALPAAERNPPV